MIPFMDDDLQNDFEISVQPSKTYKMDISQKTIGGWTDNLEAVKQAVYKILETERYDYLIYSWNYGSQLKELLGETIPLVNSEIKQRITDALLQDDRINSVSNFSFESSGEEVTAVFTVNTNMGSIQIEKAVNI
jgi:phage baseplate assembly protein W